MIARILAAGLALLLAACATTQDAQTAPDPGRFVEWAGLKAAGLPDQRVTVWLPPGYDAGAAHRYPVLYMWDGQNLFDPASTHYGKAWMVQDVLEAMVAAGTAEPHIVVGIWSPPGRDRYRSYLPERLYALTGGAVAADIERMAGGRPASDAMLAWTADVLKPHIDREFRTRPGPRNTTVVGASMGGIMACYAAFERPDVFGRAGCVSAHFALADPDVADANKAAIDAAWSRYLATLGPAGDRRVWMDHGTATLDAHYAPWQEDVARGLAAQGWREGMDFTARVYEGAEHDEIYWNRRMPEMLAWLWRK